MFDQEDGPLGVVMGVIFGIIALVIVLIIALGSGLNRHASSTAPTAPELGTTASPAAAPLAPPAAEAEPTSEEAAPLSSAEAERETPASSSEPSTSSNEAESESPAAADTAAADATTEEAKQAEEEGLAAQEASSEFADVAEVGEAAATFYFEIGSSALPSSSQDELARIVEELAAQPESIALVSGFHDETGSADFNAAVARDRAEAVRQALVSAGIPAERVHMRRPAVTLGEGDAAEARRVEVRVQAAQ